MQTIYIDVLIILNIYVNYFLLKISAKITHSPLKPPRCITASVYGSLFSLLILAPEMNVLISCTVKFAVAVSITAVAFGFHGIKRLALNTLAFFTSNLVLAGSIYAVYTWAEPDFVHFGNTYFYIDFSLLILVFSTAGLYFIVCGIRRFTDRTPENTGCYRVIIRYRDKIISAEGLADTGNTLTDFFSGLPVIICGNDAFSEITGCKPELSDLPKGFRIIPCSTVSDSGLIPVFRPDETVIVNSLTGERKPVEVMAGFGQNTGKAIFNPKLLKL